MASLRASSVTQHVRLTLPDPVPLLWGVTPARAELCSVGDDHNAADVRQRLVGRPEGEWAAWLLHGKLHDWGEGAQEGSAGVRGEGEQEERGGIRGEGDT